MSPIPFFLVVILGLTAPEHIAACSCGQLPAERAVRQPDYTVFVGTNLGWDDEENAWLYRVQRGYHNAQDGAVVSIGFDSGTCGTILDSAAVDLIYASDFEHPGRFVTGICHATKPLDEMTPPELRVLEHHRLASASRWSWVRGDTLLDGVGARVSGSVVPARFDSSVVRQSAWIDLAPIGGPQRVDLRTDGRALHLQTELTPTGATGRRTLALTISQSSADSTVSFVRPVTTHLLPTRDHAILGGDESGWQADVTFGDARLSRFDMDGQRVLAIDEGPKGGGWVIELAPPDSVDSLGFASLRLTLRAAGPITDRLGFRARLAVQIGEGPLISLLRDIDPPVDIKDLRWHVVEIPLSTLVSERFPRMTIKQLRLVASLDNTLWISDVRLVRHGAGPATAVTTDLTADDDTGLRISATPNPFNSSASFHLQVPASLHGSVGVFEIFNLLGQRMERVYLRRLVAGQSVVGWSPGSAASGVYVARLTAGGHAVTRRVMLIR